MNNTLGVVVGEPPHALQHARLDNIALVPASLLPLKDRYQPLANQLPKGSVLCVPGTQKQRTIMATVTKFFTDHGHFCFTMPLENITRQLPRPARPQPENVQLAF